MRLTKNIIFKFKLHRNALPEYKLLNPLIASIYKTNYWYDMHDQSRLAAIFLHKAIAMVFYYYDIDI